VAHRTHRRSARIFARGRLTTRTVLERLHALYQLHRTTAIIGAGVRWASTISAAPTGRQACAAGL